VGVRVQLLCDGFGLLANEDGNGVFQRTGSGHERRNLRGNAGRQHPLLIDVELGDKSGAPSCGNEMKRIPLTLQLVAEDLRTDLRSAVSETSASRMVQASASVFASACSTPRRTPPNTSISHEASRPSVYSLVLLGPLGAGPPPSADATGLELE